MIDYYDFGDYPPLLAERSPWRLRGKVFPLSRPDGDNVGVVFDPGARLRWGPWSVRLRARTDGINTPELSSQDPAEREAAQKARDYLHRVLCPAGSFVLVHTEKPQATSFDRLVGWIENWEGVDVGQALLDLGLARPFDPRRDRWSRTSEVQK